MRVYLAGPISGCSYGECTSWRDKFIKVLDEPSNKCYSPMRAKEFLANKPEIRDHFPDHLFGSERHIMTRDFDDCTKADVIVANLLGAKIVSIGTVMEIAWAFNRRIPLIAIMEPEKNLHDHPMIRQAIGFRVDTIEQAAFCACSILMP